MLSPARGFIDRHKSRPQASQFADQRGAANLALGRLLERAEATVQELIGRAFPLGLQFIRAAAPDVDLTAPQHLVGTVLPIPAACIQRPATRTAGMVDAGPGEEVRAGRCGNDGGSRTP